MARLLAFIFRTSFLVFAVLLMGFVAFAFSVPSQPNPSTTHADAIVVLTGSARRVELGYQRLQENRGDTLFISGVYNDATREEILATLAGYNKAKDRKLTPRVELGYMARDTVGNAREIAEWIASQKTRTIRSIRVVTANYHMQRSLWELRRSLPGITLIPDPAFPTPFDTAGWWYNKAALQLVASEYLKTIYCLLRPILPTQRTF